MDTLSTFAQSTLFLKFAIPVSITLFLILFFWWRAGSIHSVFDRLWRLVAGQTEVTDSRLKTFIQRNRDLEKFRFLYGIEVETQSDLHRFLTWLDRRNISIIKIQKIKQWINTKSTDFIVKPPRRFFVTTGVITIICLLVFAKSLTALDKKSGLLYANGSKTWLWTDGKTASQFMDNWVIDAASCKKGIVSIQKTTGLTLKESQEICNAFEKGSLKGLISKAIDQLRIVGIIIGSICMILLIASSFSLGSALRTLKILKELPQKSESQQEEAQPLTESPKHRRGVRKTSRSSETEDREEPSPKKK